MSTVHIIGAGLAGLSAALDLAEAGRRVMVYEAGPAAGGRCRSYFDRELGCRIDNGNHLLLSGNTAAMGFLDRIGARETMGGPGAPVFPFVDLVDGARWTVRPGRGRAPWWVFDRSRRVAGSAVWEYAAIAKLRFAGRDATVSGVLDNGRPLWRRLLEPLAIAALNTPPEEALASLLRPVIDETLLRGGDACIPLFPKLGLSESLIDPALARLGALGAVVHTSRRIAGLEIAGGRVTGLAMPDGAVALGAEDAVVLAVPAWVAGALLPGLRVPEAHQGILNVHFRTEAELPGGFLGVVGGTAEWIFVKPGIVSVTVSAANRLIDQPADVLAARIWADVQASLNLAGAMPPVRVVKEKRATFAATAAQEALRPPARTAVANLVLAGDWTATGLPATIEGAIRSGCTAAKLLGHGFPA
jgi:squalene-associated FAD-dependent desaturase